MTWNDGLEQLAGDKKFEEQTPVSKGRFFATVGSGRPSEMRNITDKQLQALNSPGFPVSEAQEGMPALSHMPDDLKELDGEDD